MKKLICFALTLLLIVSVVACSKSDTSDSQVSDNPKDDVTEPENPETQTPEVQPPSQDDKKTEGSELPADDEKQSDDDTSVADGPIEILSLIDKNLDEISSVLGEEESSYVDEFDGNTVHSFKDISVGTDQDGKIVNVLLIKDNQISEDKYTFKGMTFKNTNAEILEAVGNPVNGNNYTFVYSDDFSRWLKIDFDESGYPAMVTIFYAADQGDRTFNWE